jgi:hypothetical protein
MPNGQKYEDWLKSKKSRGGRVKRINPGPKDPGPPTEAREKPGCSGRGKVQRAPGLAIGRILVPKRTQAYTAIE